jgi:hypothetical protein
MAFMGPLGTPSNNNWILVRIEEFADVFHVTGQTVEAVPAVGMLQDFSANFVFHRDQERSKRKGRKAILGVTLFPAVKLFPPLVWRLGRMALPPFSINATPKHWLTIAIPTERIGI